MGKIICAWCGKEIGEREGIKGISHGICEECEEKEFGFLKLPKNFLFEPCQKLVSMIFNKKLEEDQPLCHKEINGKTLESAVWEVFESLVTERRRGVERRFDERQRQILILLFGLGDGGQKTLEEVGREYGVTKERIRQVRDRGLKRLRHPSRSDRLKAYIKS